MASALRPASTAVASWWSDDRRDTAGDLDTLSVNGALLGEDLIVGAGIAAVDLGNGVQGAVKPPPLPLDLAFQSTQLVQFVHGPSFVCSLFVLILLHPPDAARKLRERKPPSFRQAARGRAATTGLGSTAMVPMLAMEAPGARAKQVQRGIAAAEAVFARHDERRGSG